MQYAIDEKRTVTIGNSPQHIRIRTTDPTLPVLLFLHGGPGVCDRHWVLKYQSALAEVCTMVCYDQRGAGLSYKAMLPAEEMTVTRMVEDARELVEYLCREFQKEKILIVGHSWGSLLGTLLAHRYPEHIAAYIGMGQFVDGTENEQLSYEFVMNKAKETNNQKALRQLTAIGGPVNGHYPNRDALMVQRDWMTRFGGGTYKGKESIVGSVLIPLFLTNEYRLFDLPGYAKGVYASLDMLWEEVVDFNLLEEVPALKMPVYLTEGRHDYNTPVSIAQRWYDVLDAPKKEWIWFEYSAHSPIKEEPALWGAAVRRIVETEAAAQNL